MKKNLLFAILCVLGLFGTLNAQDVVTIDGTVGEHEVTTSKNVPAFCANKWAITQQFYTAEEIGKSSGTIESIAFKTADVAAETEKYPFTRNLEIYMVNSEDYAIVGNSFRAMSASDLVFSGNVEFTTYNAWNSIDITDFEYTGKNILICINDVTGSNVSGGVSFDVFKHSVTIDGSNAYRALYKRSTSSAFNPTATITGATVNAPVPFIQFAFASGTTEEYAEPSNPTNFVATAVNESKIQLTWDAAPETQGYNIYEGAELVANVEGTSYAVKNLALGQHCYTIKGANGPKESTGVDACATLVAKEVESITIGSTGDGDSQTAPITLYAQNSWVEQLYTAEELGGARKIERLAFAIKAANAYSEPFTTEEIKIYLAETTRTDYANQTWTALSDLELVYSETGIIIGDQEWETFEFDEPFNYSGEKNLAVVVAKSSPQSAQYFWHTNSVTNSVLYSETSTYPTESGKATLTRPVIRFAWEVEKEEPTVTVPAAPAVEATATETTVTLTWAVVEGATSYNVYQGENVVSVETTTYTAEGLEAETTYCFNVTAVNEAGESAKTEACATTAKAEEDEPIVPENPETGLFPTTFFFGFEGGNLNGLNVTDANNDKITWEYRYGSDGGGFKDEGGVYSGTYAGNKADDYLVTASKYSMTETSEFSFVFVPYDCLTYFHEKIAVVVSEDGEEFVTVWSYEIEETVSAWDTATVDLKAYAGKDLYIGLHHYGSEDGIRVDNLKLTSKEPSVPANLVATSTETTVTLTWDAVENAASYNVYSVVGEDYTLVGNATEATYTVEGLQLETEYCYTVTAVNEYKESRYAQTVCVSTKEEALPEGVELLLKETFEAYTVGDKIAEKGAEHWTTWSKKPGGAEDGVVGELDGNKYGHFTYGNDQILKLGGYTSGVFELEFDVYVPEGKGGYYNILHQFEGNTSWAVQAYFQMEEKSGEANPKISNGHGTVHAGSLNTYDVPCVYNGWMHFRVEINANIDEAVYHYIIPGSEEVEAFKWQWSKDCFGEGVVGRKLDAMNFFPPTKGTEYYVDNITLKRFGGESAPIITFGQESVDASMAGDDIASVELEIENIGTSIAEYVAWIDYGEGAMSDKYEVVSYSLEDLSTTTTIGWNPIEEPMTFEIAALYPSSAYGNSVMGTYVSAASYFLGEFKTQDGATVPMLEPGTDMTFRIYEQGINGKPGKILAEKVLPADSIILDWNVVTFDEPVLLTGFDFYLAVEMTQCVGGSAMVLDGNKDGAYQGYGDLCRQTSGTPFRSLTEFTQGEKFGNFHLMVLCMGDAVTGGWAELSKKDGTLGIGAKETIKINFTSIGLEEGKKYDAKIVFNTNTEEGVIELPLSLYVWGENVEEILSNTYNIYPNPTSAQVTVEGENINYIAVYNSVGQLVKVVKTQNNVVDMSANENGVYFFNIVDNAGQSSVQRVVVAK